MNNYKDAGYESNVMQRIMNGARLPTEQFKGVLDGKIVHTDLTDPSLPPGTATVVIPQYNKDIFFGPVPYPVPSTPPDGTAVITAFVAATATQPTEVRILATTGWEPDVLSPFLLMGG